MSTWDHMKDLITIGADVKALREELKTLTTDLRDLRDRVIRLEGIQETTVAKAETVAVKTVQQQIGIFIERSDKMQLALQKALDEISARPKPLSLVQMDRAAEPAA